MEVGEVMLVRLDIEIWEVSESVTRSGVGEWRLLHFVVFFCVLVYCCHCSVGCLFQGLHGVGVV
jgi:hypothetical protein